MTEPKSSWARVQMLLIALVFFGPQTPWGWIGLVPLFTALVSWCPAYLPFGINTASKN